MSRAQSMSIMVNNNYLLMDANTINYLSQKSQNSTTIVRNTTNIKLHTVRGTMLNATYDTTVSYLINQPGTAVVELSTKSSIRGISIKESPGKEDHNISSMPTGSLYSRLLTQLPIPVYVINPVYTITKQ